RERKLWTPCDPAGTVGDGARLIGPAGLATVKVYEPFVPPSRSSELLTVTVSPGENGCAGRKLAPSLSESPAMRPVCDPVREPTTLTEPSADGPIPRKVICVRGRAKCEPGLGNTLTCLAACEAPGTSEARAVRTGTAIAGSRSMWGILGFRTAHESAPA